VCSSRVPEGWFVLPLPSYFEHYPVVIRKRTLCGYVPVVYYKGVAIRRLGYINNLCTILVTECGVIAPITHIKLRKQYGGMNARRQPIPNFSWPCFRRGWLLDS